MIFGIKYVLFMVIRLVILVHSNKIGDFCNLVVWDDFWQWIFIIYSLSSGQQLQFMKSKKPKE